ncbi:hypothetical protein KGF56_003777 [Candida oxycetoniae]|uniref:Ribosomal protein L9 domain-containing protein n=1 Tax=Candida oxycetoniae TaxID=497107 RepID=A0AAI9SUV3_9ASCO|nr:uncharacterized protein KGF56_003777 [Candida oxycetoniae]KAI3403493.2 hypothetical protein KGF56_003777 [Candida oxycetoniae]
MSTLMIRMRACSAPSYAIRTFKQRTVNKLVEVQLLTDVPNIGVKGQVLNVKPGFMRNYLHVDNKACYITPKTPPRLPVVDIEMIRARQRKEKLEKEEAQKQSNAQAQAQSGAGADADAKAEAEQGPMSFSELSDLFNIMKSPTKKSNQVKPELQIQSNPYKSETAIPGFEEVIDVRYKSINDVVVKLPKLITLQASEMPIGRRFIAKYISEKSGFAVDPYILHLSYIDTPDQEIKEINEVGRYNVKITSDKENITHTRILEIE